MSIDKSKFAALMIGRGGSTLPNKNIMPVLGVPLLLWSASAAVKSKYLSRFYISSDDKNILETAKIAGYKSIIRPAELALPSAQSCDAVKHAFSIIEADGEIDVLVVQHANVGTISERLIDESIELLISNPQCSAVIPSHQKPEYHPYRGRKITHDGFLAPLIENNGPISANRQDLTRCYFFDHSFWVLRGRSAIFDPQGQQPWECMGRNIIPFETHGCLDVHEIEDIERTEKWIISNNIQAPFFYSQNIQFTDSDG